MGLQSRDAENELHKKPRVDVVVANENVILEALRTDVAVINDVREANAENVAVRTPRR